MAEGKWSSLVSDDYVVEDLGRPAIFLLPVNKLKLSTGVMTIEEDLHRFLIENFGAYTTSTIPNFGFWRDAGKAVISDECREYEVSISGRERVPTLLRKLAEIADKIKEECIYVKAGQYAALVYPKKPSL